MCNLDGKPSKMFYLGVFSNKEDAIRARKNAEREYFANFAYVGTNV